MGLGNDTYLRTSLRHGSLVSLFLITGFLYQLKRPAVCLCARRLVDVLRRKPPPSSGFCGLFILFRLVRSVIIFVGCLLDGCRWVDVCGLVEVGAVDLGGWEGQGFLTQVAHVVNGPAPYCRCISPQTNTFSFLPAETQITG